MRLLIALCTFALAAPLAGSTPDPTTFAARSDIAAQIAAMEADMKPSQGFLWRPLLGTGAPLTAAIEIWRAPGKPAVHPAESEYVVVLKGEGTLLSGGTLPDPAVRNPSLTEGSRIDGGTTRPLHVGDAFLVPPGTPHWFGIAPGQELVLLGMHIPQGR